MIASKGMLISLSLATCCRLCPQAQEHLEGSIGMVLYEYNNGKIGPAGMEVCAGREALQRKT